MTPAGMIVRRHSSQWIAVLRTGAGTAEEARELADGYLSRRGITAEWAKTEGGRRMKVGVAGLRRFDVIYRLERKP